MLSSAVTGGGHTAARWVLNLQVPLDYARLDPANHIAESAEQLGLTGAGIGMLTAAWVERYTVGNCDGVRVVATTGLTHPVWAAAPALDGAAPGSAVLGSAVLGDDGDVRRPGTVNLLAILPIRLSAAAMVNAVMTMTEAKSQAMMEAGMPGTGTASDAVCVAAPAAGEPVDFCGPRSFWGARLANSCHQAVATGIQRWAADHPDLDGHRQG